MLEQEDPRGVTEDLSVHIQQCVRLHQVSTETSGWCTFLSSVPFPRLTVLVFSMETLSEMFQLEIPTVHSIISKMIINEELMVRMKPIRLFDIPVCLRVHKFSCNCLARGL